MRIVFMGTPDFAVPSLEAVANAFEVCRVVTRPDAVRGRGKRLEPSPVKAKALELGLSVTETNRMTPEVIDQIRALGADLCVVAAYGCILPDALLELFPLGCINVHASLLPRWRGAAPIQRAVLAGDELVGASIMEVVHELDAGAYCAQVSTAAAGKTSGELLDEVGRLGAAALVDAINDIAAGTATWTQQDETLVTYAHKIDKAEARIDWTRPAVEVDRLIRGLSPFPGAWIEVNGERVKLQRSRLATGQGAPGRVLGGFTVACGSGAVEITEAQREGKRPMPAAEVLRGLILPAGL